jgi:hypothetical protein
MSDDTIEFRGEAREIPRQREVTVKGWFTYNPDDPEDGYKSLVLDFAGQAAYKPNAPAGMRAIRVAVRIELP